LSLEQLARLTGISAPALSLIETGKRDPRLTTLKRIADALRVPPATLMADGSDTIEPSASASAGGYDLGEYQ
jgi:transcriptional regulator with XRE-family HTH domain